MSLPLYPLLGLARMRVLTGLAVCLVLATPDAAAQNAAPPAVVVEAEGGDVGAEFETVTEGDVTYIAITTDFNETTGTADTPGAGRTATYEVTFPEAGEYALYARLYVGPEGFNDDSFFVGPGFGEHDPSTPADWVRVNGLAGAGYIGASTYVESEGTAPSEVWKWLRLTGFAESPGSFTVEDGALTQTFEIGAREDGLRLDKVAFAPVGAFYTVGNLDNGEPGVTEIPDLEATLLVDFATPIRPATHVASGALYGVTTSLPSDLRGLVAPLSPKMYTQPARGGQGYQQPYPADAIPVAERLALATDATVTVRLADINPQFPYDWIGEPRWTEEVTAVVQDKLASDADNVYGYEIWNEPYGAWDEEENGGEFFPTLWKPTYDLLRQLDPDEPIIGPSLSYYSRQRLEDFLTFCIANDCVPDIIAWHELGGPDNVTTNVESYRALEQSLGIDPLPISINEYSSDVRAEEGAPGVSAVFIARFERSGVDTANISWWFPGLVGKLGSLLTADNQRGGGWYFYEWYGQMEGDMVEVTPPSEVGDGVDGFANLDLDGEFASVGLGGNTVGTVDVVINGIPAAFGSEVDVRVEEVVWEDRNAPVSGPTTLSLETVDASAGTLTVPVPVADPLYGYRVSVAPAGRLATAIASGETRPLSLRPNRPNPFAGTTRIAYDLPAAGRVRLEVFDAVGRRVAVLADAAQPAGSHVATFDASGLPSGLYLYRLSAGGDVATRTMVVAR